MRLRLALLIGALIVVGLWLLSWAAAPFIGHGLYCEGNYHNPKYCAEYDPASYLFWITAKLFADAGDMFLALATFAIAWFTFSLKDATKALRDSTEKLWKAGDDQRISNEGIASEQIAIAARSATAAKESADALKSADRPFFNMQELRLYGLNGTPEADGKITLYQAHAFKNVGRSTLSMRGESLMLLITSGDLPAAPAYEVMISRRYVIPIGEGYGNIHSPNRSIATRVEPERISLLRAGLQTAYFYGYVEYKDIFDIIRRTPFAYRFQFSAEGDASERFIPTGGDAYWRETQRQETIE